MISSRTFSVVFLCVCALFPCAQTTAQQSSATIDEHALSILKDSGMPGGVELATDCSLLSPTIVTASTASLDVALTALARSDKHLRWTKTIGAYSVYIQVGSIVSIGSVKLPPMKFDARSLWEATDRLLQTQPIRDYVGKAGLKELPENLGFTSVAERQTRTIELPAGTLREDLSLIAKNFGVATWRLDQHQCNQQRTYRIAWVTK